MSVFSAMRTSVSGMNAQSNRLATFSENIANSGTTGYKAASAQFETLLIAHGSETYTSGGVDTRVRYGIDQQGVLSGTNSATDLAVRGGGFFVVSDANGSPHLTRAGSFIPDASGNLINVAGYKLMGADISNGQSAPTSGGFAGLSDIKINMNSLTATATTSGAFAANLPTSATIVSAANLPSANAATAQFSEKSSLVAYNSLGDKVTLDIYMTKTGANTWETSIFDASTASVGGGFPYSGGPMASTTLQFDPSNGRLTAASAKSLTVAIPGGASAPLDLSQMTQLGAAYSITNANINGNAPSRFSSVEIDSSGVLSAVYQNGVKKSLYQIQLATVPSVDSLSPLSGNVYDTNAQSGSVVIGSAGAGAMGEIVSGALENSTVDIANELTGMIETQRAYSANSKAFQVASDVTDVLVNLK